MASFLSSLQCELDDPAFSSLPSLPSSSSNPTLPSEAGINDPHLDDMELFLDSGLQLEQLASTLPFLTGQQKTRDSRLDSQNPTHGHQEQQQSSGLMAWEAEQLQLLLGITEDDLQGLTLDDTVHTPAKRTMGTSSLPVPLFPVAEIKRPNVKEAFVHPGFYSLSSQNRSNGDGNNKPLSLSLTRHDSIPPPILRKHSLPEEPNLFCVLEGGKRVIGGAGWLHRHSLDMQSLRPTVGTTTNSSFLWPTLTPELSWSTQASLQRHGSKIPPGQPYMDAFSSWLTTLHPSEHGFLHSGGLTRYRRPSIESRSSSSLSSSSSCSWSLGPSQRRRRASKYKSDLFPGATLYESNGHGSGSCPLNAVSPPLQQRHSICGYSASPHHHPYHSHPGHEASRQELQRRQLQTHPTHSNVPEPPKSATSYRRNPGEVPASTLPPDHFVFQEALLRRRSDPVLGAVGGATTVTTTETAAATGQVPYPSLSVLAAAVAASRSNSSPSLGLNTSARSSSRHVGALSSTPSSGLDSPSTTKDEAKSGQETLEEEEGGTMIKETGSKDDCDPERSEGLALGLVVSKGKGTPQETTPQRVLSRLRSLQRV